MRRYRLLTVMLVSFALAGCASTADRNPITVSPAIAGEANIISLESAGEPLASVAVDMPDMHMPSKAYTLHRTGSSTYEARNVNFEMAGAWRVNVLDGRGKRISLFTIAVR